MPIVKGPKTEVYVHDKYPLLLEPEPGGLSCKMTIFSPMGAVGFVVEGTLQTLAKQFKDNNDPPLIAG